MDFEINEIKVDISSYRHYWLGTPGVGKTTSFRDLIIEEYGDPRKGLLIVVGDESGHKALNKLQIKETPNWNTFIEVVDYLTENRSEHDIKIIGLDTVDELIEIATRQVLYLHRIQKKENATSIKQVFGGYGAGKRMVIDLVKRQIVRLEQAGYCIVFIGHTKFKDLTDKETDDQYQMLTSNLESDYHSLFANRADIMATMMIKRSIKDGKLLGEKRVIHFLPSMNVESKTRIGTLPEEIEFGASNYISAVKSALQELSGLNDSDFAKKQVEEVKTKIEKAEKIVESEVKETYGEFETPAQYIEAIKDIIKGLGAESKLQLKANLKTKDLPEAFTKIEDIELLKKIYSVANQS